MLEYRLSKGSRATRVETSSLEERITWADTPTWRDIPAILLGTYEPKITTYTRPTRRGRQYGDAIFEPHGAHMEPSEPRVPIGVREATTTKDGVTLTYWVKDDAGLPESLTDRL